MGMFRSRHDPFRWLPCLGSAIFSWVFWPNQSCGRWRMVLLIPRRPLLDTFEFSKPPLSWRGDLMLSDMISPSKFQKFLVTKPNSTRFHALSKDSSGFCDYAALGWARNRTWACQRWKHLLVNLKVPLANMGQTAPKSSICWYLWRGLAVFEHTWILLEWDPMRNSWICTSHRIDT